MFELINSHHRLLFALVALVALATWARALYKHVAYASNASRLPIPPASDSRPTSAHRVAVLLFVLLPWACMYFGVRALGVPTHHFDLSFDFENRWPILQWTTAIYVSAYIQAPLAIVLAASQRGLRRFALAGATATVVVALCWILIPAAVVHRPFPNPHGPLGKILTFSRDMDDGSVSFPSFHVMWAFIAADVWTDRARITHRPWLRAVGWTWATAIALSTLTTGMHYLVDIIAAVGVYLVVRSPERLLSWDRGPKTEHLGPRTEDRGPKLPVAI